MIYVKFSLWLSSQHWLTECEMTRGNWDLWVSLVSQWSFECPCLIAEEDQTPVQTTLEITHVDCWKMCLENTACDAFSFHVREPIKRNQVSSLFRSLITTYILSIILSNGYVTLPEVTGNFWRLLSQNFEVTSAESRNYA